MVDTPGDQGSCAIWSMWYMIIRVTYPDIQPAEIISSQMSSFSSIPKEYYNESLSRLSGISDQEEEYSRHYIVGFAEKAIEMGEEIKDILKRYEKYHKFDPEYYRLFTSAILVGLQKY